MAKNQPIGYRSLFDEFEQFPIADFQSSSFQLEEFRCDDMSSMEAELSALISDSDDVYMRHIPIVKRFAKDRASLWVRDPEIKLGLPKAQTRDFDDLLVAMNFTEFMAEAAQIFAAQHGVLIVPLVFDGMRIALRAFLPGECDIEQNDLLDNDIRYAKRVTIRVPVMRDNDGETVVFGSMILTPDWAYVETESRGAKVRRGVYRDDLRNPFGYIPVCAVTEHEPRKGQFWNNLPQSLQALQISSSIGISDADFIARFQAFGREVLIGAGAELAAENMIVGANRMMIFDTPGDAAAGSKLEYHMINGDPKIDLYLKSIEFAVRMFEEYAYMRRGNIGGSSAITGAGVSQESIPFQEERERIEKKWRRAVRETCALIRDIANVSLLIPFHELRVSTTFHYVEPKVNTLQDEQAAILRYAFGQDGPIARIMRVENVSSDDAKKLFVDRLTEMAEALKTIRKTFGGTIPGLDEIGKAIGAKGNTNDNQRDPNDHPPQKSEPT